MITRTDLLIGLLIAALSTPAAAQTRGWAADASVGWAGFVDDATRHYWSFGGSVRKLMTPKLSIGPEIVVMSSSNDIRDRHVFLTGNVQYELSPHRRVSPFVVGGGGILWGRDQVGTGPYWFTDPAFTAGGGIRTRLSDRARAAIEYRVGWELHHRVTGSLGLEW
jgi:hypothetical protein